MSNFRSKAFNPSSKRVEVAEYCDNYYGRHRYGIRFDDGCVHPEAQCGIDAAATQLDALLKERDSLQARVRQLEGQLRTVQNAAKTIAACQGAELEHLRQNRTFDHKLRAEHESLLARDAVMTDALEAAESRALRAEQERDEAYERADYYAKRVEESLRRLASPEKEKKE